MFDLIYPIGLAPGIGEKEKEMLPIVNENGEVEAIAGRVTAHSSKLLHPVVRLCIVNRSGNFFLQKRSASVNTHPGKWDSACAGHVLYGEQILEALFREAGEELGFQEFNPVFIDSRRQDVEDCSELVCTFAAVGSFNLNPSTEEVECGAWWTADDIEAGMGKSVFTPSFEEEWALYKNKFLSLL